LLFMLLLRLKRPEHLRQRDPVQFGRILGLDRAPRSRRQISALPGPRRDRNIAFSFEGRSLEQSARAVARPTCVQGARRTRATPWRPQIVVKEPSKRPMSF
jgi:hypothetical protein